MAEPKFTPLSHYGPVTAIQFNGGSLFTASGPVLKEYDWQSGVLKRQKQIFPRNKIHGIQINGHNIAVWGGRSFSLFSFDEFTNADQKIVVKKIPDWICSVAFAKGQANCHVFIQTAHNSIICADEALRVVDIVGCEERSILYSGTILPLDGGDALIAAGTVLGGVVVWRLSTRSIISVMTQHEGSIFGVRFSSDGQRIVSCSDDRSIRLWDVNSGSQVAIGWGHLARIWQLDFFNNNKYILSVSEDSTARIWSISEQDSALHCLQVLDGHVGRNAWCAAMTEDESVIATGGGDGRVLLWDIEQRAAVDNNRVQWSPQHAITNAQKGETFKSYVMLANKLVASTSTGRVFKLEASKWSELEVPQLDSYSLVRGWPQFNMASVTKRDGTVVILDFNNGQDYVVHNRKLQLQGAVTDVLPFSIDGRPFFLAESQNPKDNFILHDVMNDKSAQLCVPESFLATSVSYYEQERLLILGSRLGGICVYERGEETMQSQDPIAFNYCARRVVSSDAITSIIITDPGRLLFTSRAGHFAEIFFDKESVKPCSINKLPRGTIEGSKLINGHVLLYGFRNDVFFVWNDTLQLEVFSEYCGGAHRQWYLNLTDNICQFAFTKVSNISIVDTTIVSPKISTPVLEDGTHGREIRVISSYVPKGDVCAFATASEDTTVRFGVVSKHGSVHYSAVYRDHVSGIQSGHWTTKGQYFVTSAAREELIFWKVHFDDQSPEKVRAYAAAKLPPSTDVPDLRIMDFAIISYSEAEHLLALVYSDSTVKVFKVNVPNSTFDLLAQETYTTWCLLNCHFLPSEDGLYLCVSSTDGHICVWHLANSASDGTISKGTSFGSRTTFPLHQSGIKESAIISRGNSFYHISGGDDNALSLCQITCANGTATFEVLDKVDSAHSSTIAGLDLVSDGTFVTSGVDQDVSLWTIEDNKIAQIVQKSSQYTTVADTGPVETVTFSDKNIVLVGGSGLSVWGIDQ